MPLKSGRFFFSDWHSSKLEIDGIPLIDVSGQDPPCIDYLTLSALTGCLQAREWLKCISLGFIFAFVGFSAGIGGAWRLSGNIFFNSQFLWTAAGEPWVVLACCGGLDESSHSLPPPLSLLSNAHHQCTQTTLLRSDSVQSIALFCSATKCIAIFNSAYSAVPSVALSWKTTQDHSRWKRHCNASRTRNQSLDGNEWRWWDWHQILEEPDTEQSKNTSGPTKHSFLLRKKKLVSNQWKNTLCVVFYLMKLCFELVE